MSFDPQQTYSLSLDFYADVPAETRPCLTYRRINGREYGEIVRENCEHTKSIDNGGHGNEHVYAALRVGLVDWKNQIDPSTNDPVAFDPQRLCDILDPVEAIELVSKRLYAARVNGKQLKNSG